MRNCFVVLTILTLMMVMALAACDGAAAPGGPVAAQPNIATVVSTREAGARSTPGAQRQPNFTPGAQRPPNFTPGAQRTPQAAATAASTLAAPTTVVVTAITNTTGIAPTAVPIPQVVIPTAVPAYVPASAPTPSPAPAPVTSGTAAAPTTAPMTVESLRGQLVFSSDRDSPYPQLYVMEPNGSNPRLCNCVDLWQTLTTNEYTSPDKKQFLFVKAVGGSLRGADMQIWAHNNETGADSFVTGGAPGFPGVDYDAVWSPDSKHVAWVSEANGFDEIYLYDASAGTNERLIQSSGEWYKHPSFSPDGSQIVFWSNHADANFKQIWMMNLDGSNLRDISHNQHNDFDPIWVK